mgnify:CR=1 FL=1
MLKKGKIPHTYVIVFFIVILAAVLTWIIPGGEFERIEKPMPDGSSRVIIEPDSFNYVENEPQTWQVFSSVFDGFVDKANIIVFILLIGGAFWIMNASKAIDVGIYSFLRFTKRVEHWKFFRIFGVDNVVITLIMLMFSIFGAVFGMSEETIAFVIIFVPLAISMGYDSIVGVSMCFVAAGLGFAGAMLNPFTIGIAQGLSDIPLFSGIEYRFFCWIIINIVGIAFVLRYAKKVKKNPKRSLVYDDDEYWRGKSNDDVENVKYHTPKSGWITYGLVLIAMIIYSVVYPQTTMSVGNSSTTMPIIPILTGLYALIGVMALRKSVHFYVLSLLMFTILFLIVGVMGYDWYVMKIATLFFAMGIASGIAMNNSPNEITKLFLDGVKDIMGAAMIVGLAGGIIVILQDGKVIDTLLYYVSKGMADFGRITSIGMMYVIQNLINIIIPSGSAKAALTMPIMAPFSDLIGISRQATVMAFQFGDGFTNMITPTSGILIGVLGVARIPYEKWVRGVTPLRVALLIPGFLLLIPTVTMDLNGF